MVDAAIVPDPQAIVDALEQRAEGARLGAGRQRCPRRQRLVTRRHQLLDQVEVEASGGAARGTGRVPAHGPRAPICRAASGSASSAMSASPNARRSLGSESSTPDIAVDDLVLNAADPARDDRPLLPHRLGDGEAEPLGQALLDDHLGVALDRVDDRRVLLDVDPSAATPGEPAADAEPAAPPMPRSRCDSTSIPSGSSATERSPGRRAADARRFAAPHRSTNPCITPIGSFSRSQRETWTITRSVGVSGATSQISARRSIRPGVPSVRVNVGATLGRSSTMPARDRIERDCSRLWSAFFGEKMSIEGWITAILPRSRPSQTNADRENTYAIGSEHVRRRNVPRAAARGRWRDRRRRGSARSRPRRCAARQSTSPAVCGSCRITTSLRAHELGELCGVGGKRLLVDRALIVGQFAAVAVDAVQMVVDPLRDAEELGPAEITTQRASTPLSRE